MADQYGINLGAVQNARQTKRINALNIQGLEQANVAAKQNQQVTGRRNALFSQYGGDVKNRESIAEQMYSVDPAAAMKMEEQIKVMKGDERKQLEFITQHTGKLAASVLGTPDDQFDQVYQGTLMKVAKKMPGAVDDAPPMNAPIAEKRQWLQQQVTEASTMQEILDRTKPETYGQPVQALGPDGQPAFVQVGKQGGVRPIDGYAPIPKGKSGFKMVSDGKGGFTIASGDHASGVTNQNLTKPTTTKIQKDLISLEESFARVQSIGDRYNRSFMTYQGKIGAKISAIKDKANIDLSPEEKSHLKEFTKFRTLVNRDFNAYRKLITGAAASVQELESLKKATIAEDQSPAEFEANMDVYREELMRVMRIKRRMLREGIAVGDKGFGDKFDNYYLNSNDDDSELRLADLLQGGASEEEALDSMIDEGYQ